MTSDQFDQVVEAISEGRYSWACALILRFAGYNPMHFIPMRTYSRLLKENRERRRNSLQDRAENSIQRQRLALSAESNSTSRRVCLDRELEYTENVDRQTTPVKGGYFPLICGYPWHFWSLAH
jgi:hypothetical protein